MERQERLQIMVQEYTTKKNELVEASFMEFHRKRILDFLVQFRGFVALHKHPGAELLANAFFTRVEAVTIVAKLDFQKIGTIDAVLRESFCKYFSEYDKLISGVVPLEEGIQLCLDALG
jgi:hypothetical protein